MNRSVPKDMWLDNTLNPPVLHCFLAPDSSNGSAAIQSTCVTFEVKCVHQGEFRNGLPHGSGSKMSSGETLSGLFVNGHLVRANTIVSFEKQRFHEFLYGLCMLGDKKTAT
jgi:hypothetical protein